MDSQITFGYWGTRGRGQTGRLLLHYTQANWVDKKYTSPDAWFEQDKKNIGFSFPNLPYLIEGNLKITESMGIFRYIINRSEKKDLLGKDLQDQGRVDNLTGVYEDVEKAIFSSLLFAENLESEKPQALEKVKGKLGLVQKFYGQKQFALGYLTFVDFLFAEFAYYLRALDTAFYQKFPFLQKLRKAFNDLAQIKSYYEKEDAIKFPFMPPYAKIQPSLD